MDEQKDTKGDGISRLIDAQLVRTDPFGNSRAAERLYRRAERICAALYLLTRHIPEIEPVRMEIRSESIRLLEKILDLKEELRAAESGLYLSFESSVRRLISLVRILTAGGFISFQNADTVIGALDELGAYATSSQRTDLAESVYLRREDLLGDTSPLSDRNIIKDIKDKRIIKDKSDVKDAQVLSDSTLSVTARSQGIIEILRSTGEMGIKDIAARLPDYSEKMIQRELALLVQVGQAKKAGSKRWSKYSIA